MKRKRTWNRKDQCLWECASTAINGLKRCEWLTSKQHEKIINLLQKAVDNKAEEIL